MITNQGTIFSVTYTDDNALDEPLQAARTRLHRLAANWGRRAQVKRDELRVEDLLLTSDRVLRCCF
ncbi:hypothetical protein C2W62_33875 [Candidatus Entotheonella serta]|nr:hypothetical protein C2W62_33875 [Candidatus Entotheonella serta]